MLCEKISQLRRGLVPVRAAPQQLLRRQRLLRRLLLGRELVEDVILDLRLTALRYDAGQLGEVFRPVDVHGNEEGVVLAELPALVVALAAAALLLLRELHVPRAQHLRGAQELLSLGDAVLVAGVHVLQHAPAVLRRQLSKNESTYKLK